MKFITASQATSTTLRPSPPWLITSQPSVWGTSTIRYPTTARIPLSDFDPLSTVVSIVNKNNNNDNINNNNNKHSVSNKSQHSDNEYSNNNNNNNNNANDSTTNRSKTVTKTKLSGIQTTNSTSNLLSNINSRQNENASVAAVTKPMSFGNTVSSSTFSAPSRNINLNNNNNNNDESTDQSNVSTDYANQKSGNNLPI